MPGDDRGDRRAADPQGEPLTRREREVLALLAQGYSGPEIAEKLTLGLSSVKSHTQHVYGKLGVNSKRQALVRARELGLLQPPADASAVVTLPAPAGRAGPTHNLPRQVTRLFGRQREVAQLVELITQHPLVTLTGSGGVGKTRLALQAAEAVQTDFADGVWLVRLAALSDSVLVPQQVVAALGVRDEPGRSVPETLATYLGERELLLVLDNCEHLLDACASLSETLLRACPRLRVLASSREPLGAYGEMVFRVPSLLVPDSNAKLPLERISDFAAVSLFIDRARLLQPNYQVTAKNAAAVTRICQLLDGIPLAIEMAAARVNLLTADQLAERLDDAFRVLTVGTRTALPRHQTLRATIDWSYQLLTEAERRLLQRLSVFAGGCTLEAAEAVCSGDGLKAAQILDIMGSLEAKSVVTAERGLSEEARYRLLETIRQYGREKVGEAGEAEALQARHLDYFLGLAETAEPKLKGSEQMVWLARLDVEIDNLRAALEYSRVDRASNEKGLQLAGALFWFWHIRNHVSEPLLWLRSALAQGGPSERSLARATALYAAAGLGTRLGYDDGLHAKLEESISIFRAAGSAGERGLAYALVILGWWLGFGVDRAAVTSLGRETVALFRELGDRWGQALALTSFADIQSYPVFYVPTRDQEASARASDLVEVVWGEFAADPTPHEESLALFRELGDRWAQTMPLASLAQRAIGRGDYKMGRALVEECLAIQQAFGDKHGTASSLNQLGSQALAQGDLRQAAMFYEEGLTLLIGFELTGDAAAGVRDLLAEVARRQADFLKAEELYSQSLAVRRVLGNREGEANSLDGLGRVAGSQGDLPKAYSLQIEALAIRGQGSIPVGLAQSLHALAVLAAAKQSPVLAARLFGAVEASLAVLYNCGLPIWRAEHENSVAAVRAQLDEAGFMCLWAEGEAMTLEQAVAFASSELAQ